MTLLDSDPADTEHPDGQTPLPAALLASRALVSFQSGPGYSDPGGSYWCTGQSTDQDLSEGCGATIRWVNPHSASASIPYGLQFVSRLLFVAAI